MSKGPPVALPEFKVLNITTQVPMKVGEPIGVPGLEAFGPIKAMTLCHDSLGVPQPSMAVEFENGKLAMVPATVVFEAGTIITRLN